MSQLGDDKPPMTDEALMEAFQKGDDKAFAVLVERHETKLWNFLRRYVGDAATAEDLLQDLFMRVLAHAADWTPAAKVTTWMYTIARNLCTDHARRAVHRKVTSLDGAASARSKDDDSGPILVDRLAGSDPGGEHKVAMGQMIGQLDLALAALPDEQREVFLMREVMDLSFAEIALAVSASEPTVKSRMRYALERLRTALVAFRESGTMAAAVEAQT